MQIMLNVNAQHVGGSDNLLSYHYQQVTHRRCPPRRLS